MGDVKEYIRGDKHVHQAGSVMIKIVQYNVPGQRQEGCCQQADEDAEAQERNDAEELERNDAEELEREFADYEEVDDAAGADAAPSVRTDPELPPASRFVNRVKAIVMEAATKNGQMIVTNTRAWRGGYVFFVDGERIGRMMDDLMKNHEEKIV